MPITSHQNEKLKNLRRLRERRRDRDRTGQFVAEGEDLLAAADAAGWRAVERFAVTDSGLPGIEVEPAVLDRFSELGSGTRTLAIYEQRWHTLDELRPTLNHEIDPTLNQEIDPALNHEIDPALNQATGQTPHQIEPRAVCVYLHALSDPGNVGTILRSAAAFGVGCVAFGPGTADPFGPKAVRASMGAIFTVPVLRAQTIDLPGVKLALDAKAPATLAETIAAINPSSPISLLIGAERDGLPDDVLRRADHVAAIPILTESLNAAIAASVALYELARSSPNPISGTTPGAGLTP